MSKISIGFKELDVEVEYDYQPEEKEVRYYSDGSGYPGCAASLEICNVWHEGVDITAFFEEAGLIYQLEEQVMKNLNNRDDD